MEKTIDDIRRLLNPYYDAITLEEEAASAIKISAATEKHFGLRLTTLQDAPSDENKLKKILKAKQKEYEKAEDRIDIERLITEIEILRYVLFWLIEIEILVLNFRAAATSYSPLGFLIRTIF